jgi:putative colanic acid biosynthesis glycosyltransferase
MMSKGDCVKILFIDVICGNGSTGKIVYDLYTECRKEGHEATVCYGRGRIIDEQNIFKFGLDLETYFHAVMTRLTGLTGCYSFFSTRRLLKFMKEFKPDVVHLHELHGYYMNLYPVIDYLKRKKIKTIWTFHCEFMYTGKCGHAFDCEGWKGKCGKCPQLKEYPSSLLFDFTRKMLKEKKRMFEGFDKLKIVTPSRWLANRVQQSFLGGRDIRVVHNGIDIQNVFHPRTFKHLRTKHKLSNEKIVLAIAPDLMSKNKGGSWVLELAERLKDQRIKFIMIGIKDMSSTFPDNVIAMGRNENQQELAEYYSMSDIFVICSKRENFPTTCIEALSCGTPVIGFDGGGTKETAPEGYGIFVPHGDIDSLEKTVRSVFDGSIKLKSKEECAQFGKGSYDKEVMTKNYMSIYNEKGLEELS